MENLHNSRLSQYDKISLVFAFLYPIIPMYFKIGVSFTYVMYAVILVFIFGQKKLNFVVKMNFAIIAMLIWVVTNCFLYILHMYYVGAVWTMLMALAIFFYGMEIRDANTFKSVILSISYATGVICILGIFEGITGYNVFEILNNSNADIMYNPPRFGRIRILTFAYHTISYCTYLMLASAIIFYAMSIIEKQQKKISILLKLIYVLLWINVVLTLSRSAMIVFILQQLLMLWGLGAKKIIKILFNIVVISLLCLALIIFIKPEIMKNIENVIYMLLAIFDSNYTELIANDFGSDNLEAVGTRVILYEWVYERVKDNIMFGVGYNKPFNYVYIARYGTTTYMGVKEAIEVEYLMTLYKTGIVGLIVEVLAFISIPITAIKKRLKPASWENSLSFNYVVLITMICLMIQYFFVNQSSEQNMLYLIIALFIGYNCKNKFQ